MWRTVTKMYFLFFNNFLPWPLLYHNFFNRTGLQLRTKNKYICMKLGQTVETELSNGWTQTFFFKVLYLWNLFNWFHCGILNHCFLISHLQLKCFPFIWQYKLNLYDYPCKKDTLDVCFQMCGKFFKNKWEKWNICKAKTEYCYQINLQTFMFQTYFLKSKTFPDFA